MFPFGRPLDRPIRPPPPPSNSEPPIRLASRQIRTTPPPPPTRAHPPKQRTFLGVFPPAKGSCACGCRDGRHSTLSKLVVPATPASSTTSDLILPSDDQDSDSSYHSDDSVVDSPPPPRPSRLGPVHSYQRHARRRSPSLGLPSEEEDDQETHTGIRKQRVMHIVISDDEEEEQQAKTASNKEHPYLPTPALTTGSNSSASPSASEQGPSPPPRSDLFVKAPVRRENASSSSSPHKATAAAASSSSIAINVFSATAPRSKPIVPANSNKGKTIHVSVTCHQDKTRSDRPKMHCINSPECKTLWCDRCIAKHYSDFVVFEKNGAFVCPCCLDVCTCAICRRKRQYGGTGRLEDIALLKNKKSTVPKATSLRHKPVKKRGATVWDADDDDFDLGGGGGEGGHWSASEEEGDEDFLAEPKRRRVSHPVPRPRRRLPTRNATYPDDDTKLPTIVIGTRTVKRDSDKSDMSDLDVSQDDDSSEADDNDEAPVLSFWNLAEEGPNEWSFEPDQAVAMSVEEAFPEFSFDTSTTTAFSDPVVEVETLTEPVPAPQEVPTDVKNKPVVFREGPARRRRRMEAEANELGISVETMEELDNGVAPRPQRRLSSPSAAPPPYVRHEGTSVDPLVPVSLEQKPPTSVMELFRPATPSSSIIDYSVTPAMANSFFNNSYALTTTTTTTTRSVSAPIFPVFPTTVPTTRLPSRAELDQLSDAELGSAMRRALQVGPETLYSVAAAVIGATASSSSFGMQQDGEGQATIAEEPEEEPKAFRESAQLDAHLGFLSSDVEPKTATSGSSFELGEEVGFGGGAVGTGGGGAFIVEEEESGVGEDWTVGSTKTLPIVEPDEVEAPTMGWGSEALWAQEVF